MESVELSVEMVGITLLVVKGRSHSYPRRTVTSVSAPWSFSRGADGPDTYLLISPSSPGGQRQEECACTVSQPQNGRDHSSRKLQE